MIQPYSPNVWTPPSRKRGRVILPGADYRERYPGERELQRAMPYMGSSFRFGAPAFDVSGYSGYGVEYDAFGDYPYTADDFATLCADDGDACGGWKDKNADTYPISQATAGLRPTYHTGGPNGYPYVTGDGSNDALSRGTGPTLNNPTTAYFVCRQETWGNKAAWSQGAGGLSLFGQSGGVSSPDLCCFNAAPTDAITSDLALSVWGVVTCIVRDAPQIRVNLGTRQDGSGGTFSGANGLTLFNTGNQLAPCNISFVRVIIFGGVAHSTADQDEIVTGLMAQYGIS